MAAGSTGDATMGDPREVPNMRATMERMNDSITALHRQMAELLEDPGSFNRRNPDSLDTPIEDHDEKGPAIRERIYAQTLNSDREKMREMSLRISDLEGMLAFYNSELTTDRNNMEAMSNAIKDMRSGTSAPPASVHGAGKEKQVVTAIRGFDKIRIYKGVATEWKEWKFKLSTWLAQSTPSFETLLVKLDYSETELVESAEGRNLFARTAELTSEEEWCSEQLYQLIVQKCEGPALDIIRNQNTKGKARGLIAWYRTLREAEGQISQNKSEISEKVFSPDRKAVSAKDVVATIEAYENDIREYQILTGNPTDNTMMVVNLKKIMPETIRGRLDTLDLESYKEAKEYAIKQSRNLKKNSKHSSLDSCEHEEEPEVERQREPEKKNKKTRFQEEGQDDDGDDPYSSYSREDLFFWMGKGPGKGNNKGKGKHGKGGFQGTCHYCGVYGHRINECRKKDADMKGKGKGQDVAWFPPSPNKGKGKGQKGFWKGGKGKGAYSVDDDWSAGYSGYSYDAPLLLGSLTEEAAGEWIIVNPKKASRPPNPKGQEPDWLPMPQSQRSIRRPRRRRSPRPFDDDGKPRGGRRSSSVRSTWRRCAP